MTLWKKRLLALLLTVASSIAVITLQHDSFSIASSMLSSEHPLQAFSSRSGMPSSPDESAQAFPAFISKTSGHQPVPLERTPVSGRLKHPANESDSCAHQGLRVLLVAYFRSGSSFLGDLMQQNCRTFYSFEPLHYMTEGVRIPDARTNEALYVLGKIFDCSFPEITHYVKWALKPENRFLFRWNRMLWTRCRVKPVSCFNAAFVKDVCKRSRVQVIKTTRIHMRHVRLLIESLDKSTRSCLKVVYLVRDPRGIFNSRKNLIWCANKTCADPRVLCSDMQQDLQEFKKLKSTMPGQVSIVRYEDLALFPTTTVMSLMKHLELPFSKQIERFLNSHTHADPKVLQIEKQDPYSTRRNSIETATEWVNRLSAVELQKTQYVCRSVIEELHYVPYVDLPTHAHASPVSRASAPFQYVKRLPDKSSLFDFTAGVSAAPTTGAEAANGNISSKLNHAC